MRIGREQAAMMERGSSGAKKTGKIGLSPPHKHGVRMGPIDRFVSARIYDE